MVKRGVKKTAAAAPTPKPKRIGLFAPRKKTQKVVAAPRPQVQRPAVVSAPVTNAAPQPAPIRRQVPQTVAVAPQTATPAPAPAPQPSRVVASAGAATVCPGKTPASQQYIPNDTRFPFRCGPQGSADFARVTGQAATVPQSAQPITNSAAIAPVTAQRAIGSGKPVPSTSLPGNTRVVPLHVARQRASVGTFAVPEGYEPAWNDDRLNPFRAQGTLAGRDRMNLIWTTDVPRRLIDRSSGRDVTAKVALVYPFTDLDVQRQQLGEVTLMTRNGQTLKRIVRNKSKAAPKRVVKTTAPARTVVASRSAQPKARVAAQPRAKTKAESIAGIRYVQVGMFGVQSNAQATARKMKRLGLPVRIGKFERSGKTLRMVLAGPFADDRTAAKALSVARRAGFGDAFLRK